MASFMKLPSGSWRVQVRRKGRYVSETFLRREDARRWALDAECQVDRGDGPIPSRLKRLKTFGDLIDLHVEDMNEVDNPRTKMLTIRDHKDPRQKKGNDQPHPRPRHLRLRSPRADRGAAIGPRQRGRPDIPFQPPVGRHRVHTRRSVKIEDLHFHDPRHEGASRLFEAGFPIQHVALVTGHKDWKMLRRYTHLKPESLHAFAAARTA